MGKVLFAWDFHGVLEKGNEYAVQETCNRILEEFGKTRRITLKETLDWYGISWYQYYKNLCPNSSDKEIREMVEKDLEIGMVATEKFMKPMDYAVEVLNEIKQGGNSNMIISNSRPENIKDFLKAIGISTLVDDYIGVPKEKESGNLCIATHKGHILRDYAKKHGFSKIVMIGDKETDVEAGNIAGATTFRFVNKDLLLDEEIIHKIRKESKANYVITDLRKVLNILNGPMV